ncbi:hypothetical protein NM208_g14513 [Fusarium decemcellulare]|uniref:Uncharacterized protein n=1 Tax=Fusarium decemcellulare TaxID=57161 RepID=A0ACC1RID4_9HYPO|nr:hypothetical protein NM208_g14513 [Fusarium decemcellulare]
MESSARATRDTARRQNKSQHGHENGFPVAGFTLADEARNTSQHDHSYLANNLRQRPVTFVSAGSSEPLKLLDVLLDDATKELEGASPAHLPSGEYSNPPEAHSPHESDDEGESGDVEKGTEQDVAEPLDFIGPDELEEAIQAEAVPEPDSPDEPSFFFDLEGDRSKEISHSEPVEIPERPSSRSSSSSDEIILFKGRGAPRKAQPATEISMTQMQTEIRVVEQAIVTEPTVEPPSTKKLSKKERKQKRHNKRNAQTRFEDEEDAILADYIANMKENSEVDDYFKELIQGGMDTGLDESEDGASDSSSAKFKQHPSSTNPKATDTDESNKDEDDGLGEDEDDEDDEDENPIEIDDETLAKLIAGQDLGMEDVNFGDSSSESDSSDDDKPKKQRQTVNHDDFDVMDWHRPSLRQRKGKGAKAQINFNVSDSELEAHLQAAWKNDRQKKSERKRQREEMRALGMLGKKANPEDLRVKYPDGINMEQVAEELREFLVGSDDQLALPPMDNHARKMIHELANKFKIKSKSTGKADQRRPTLYRTGRTLPYVEATFDQAINRVNRRYFPRLDMKGKKSKRLPPNRGGAGVAAASYQDGEIVGGSAPELGVENRGRAMLEKMGWSRGTALGAMNNKGILQPVTHAMKKSKAGLG